jgi:phospholipid/cholesterol/gamma-HCH transport system substrate-binding protein
VAGLPKGAPVSLAGQRVGQVDEMEFIPMSQKPGGKNVLLRLAIAREVQEQIRADSEARMRTQGLLGDKYIDISPGSLRAAVLQAGDTVRATPPVDFDALLATAQAALDTARLTVSDLRHLTSSISTGQGTLGRLVNDDVLYTRTVTTLTELQTTLAQVNRSDGTFGRLMRDPALYNRMQTAALRVDSIGAMILRGQGSMGKLLQDDAFYTGLVGVIGRADTAVTGLSGFLGRFNHTNGSTPGTFQRLMTDPALYDNFLRAVVDLQTLIRDIRANPKRYRPEVNVDVF